MGSQMARLSCRKIRRIPTVPLAIQRRPSPENTALIVIDMQTDFCGKGGYIDLLGYDISPDPRLHRTDPSGCSTPCERRDINIMHTREGHRPDLADLPANKRWRSRRFGAGIGDDGPCGPRPGRAANRAGTSSPSLYPVPGETIIDKPGKGSFCATDLIRFFAIAASPTSF